MAEAKGELGVVGERGDVDELFDLGDGDLVRAAIRRAKQSVNSSSSASGVTRW
jgi:hypothetical protein